MSNFEGDEKYITILRHETIPALGCTDPVAIALAAAKSRETLGMDPERIEVRLSRNMLKNAMGVGIPGTGTSGIDTAAALGVFGGDSSAGLQVLAHVDPEQVERAARFVQAGRVSINLKDTSDVLYIEVTLFSDEESACTLIQGDYTRIVRVERNGEPVFVLLSTPEWLAVSYRLRPIQVAAIRESQRPCQSSPRRKHSTKMMNNSPGRLPSAIWWPSISVGTSTGFHPCAAWSRPGQEPPAESSISKAGILLTCPRQYRIWLAHLPAWCAMALNTDAH